MDKITQKAKDLVLAERLTTCYAGDTVKPVFTPAELANEMVGRLPSVGGSILVISDLGLLVAVLRRLKADGLSRSGVTFVAHTAEQEAFAQDFGVKIWQVGYNDPIIELMKRAMGLKFDIIVGNPPFNGKSSIHLKMVGLMEKHITDNGLISLILPKPILVRKSERIQKHTAWIDTCTAVEWHDIDMKRDFPTVGDDLIWFTVRNDHGNKMVDLTVAPPAKTWSGRYVTGLDFGVCKKKPEGEFTIPVINCIGNDGKPTFGKFTRQEELQRLQMGKILLHVNGAGSMAAREEVAWLDPVGQHPYYRHYMETIVFDDLQEAQEALAWIKGPSGKKYFSDWLKCGWGITTGLKLLIKHQEK